MGRVGPSGQDGRVREFHGTSSPAHTPASAFPASVAIVCAVLAFFRSPFRSTPMVKSSRSRRWIRAGGVALAAVGLGVSVVATQASASTPARASKAAPSAAAKGAPEHIFVIMMENHGTKQVIGNTAVAPFITSLAKRYN